MSADTFSRVDTQTLGASDFIDTMPVPKMQHPEPGYDGALMEGAAICLMAAVLLVLAAVGAVHLIARLFA